MLLRQFVVWRRVATGGGAPARLRSRRASTVAAAGVDAPEDPNAPLPFMPYRVAVLGGGLAGAPRPPACRRRKRA